MVTIVEACYLEYRIINYNNSFYKISTYFKKLHHFVYFVYYHL